MQIFLNQYIIHYLNHTLTMHASPQLKVSTFPPKKVPKIMNFKMSNAHFSPSFYHSKIIKNADKVKIENCLFISKYRNNKLPSIFTNQFTFS